MTTKDKPETEPADLSPAAVAKRIGVARTTVYDWIRAGTIRARRVGGRWRIPLAAVLEFEKSTEYTPPVTVTDPAPAPAPAPRRRPR